MNALGVILGALILGAWALLLAATYWRESSTTYRPRDYRRHPAARGTHPYPDTKGASR